MAQLGEGEHLLVRWANRALVPRRLRTLVPTLHNLANNILLLLKILIDVGLAKLVLIFRALVLVRLKRFLRRVSRHDAGVRSSSRRILKGVARR